ncbi:glycoside hydrolase superfamily [Mycotypha africana]|uniref:glycoside hydrolase superfamily n=1 Tax=Mycotypha africana TaxID=64632 RepID=UPI0023011BE8|nr:glycoside hydrolase superfamily [Mycotypha africana]KAI8991186.1 glycoside hydrolase superfamily [Mycotypha africana]
MKPLFLLFVCYFDLVHGQYNIVQGCIKKEMSNHCHTVTGSDRNESFITVKGNRFFKANDIYYIKGANYWQGINLAAAAISQSQYSDDSSSSSSSKYYHDRLMQELDQLQKMGVNNLRIMASSEGPDTEPYRMRPSLQPSAGKYNEDVLNGLDYLLFEMKKRDMTAVMVLNNFWHWSGGFSQYIAWAASPPGSISIPYPVTRDKWDEFERFAKSFYTNELGNELFKQHIRFIQTRFNTYTGKVYNADPVIMSWQIGNEPQLPPKSWYEDIASFIKQGSPHQLVSSGIESKYDVQDFLNAHDVDAIDYCTCHCWAENWGKYNPTKENDLANAIQFAREFLLKIHNVYMPQLQRPKPLIVEEFGLARDAWRYPGDSDKKYDSQTPITHRDQYFKEGIYKVIETKKFSDNNGYFGGSNFWAFAGIGRPTDRPDSYGMTWLGDPPHERKGWYSVYDKDSTTIHVIQNHFQKLSSDDEI